MFSLSHYFKKPHKSILGLDIGHNLVTIVELALIKNNLTLHAFALAAYSSEDNLVDIIRPLIKSNSFKSRNVATCIPDSLIYQQNLAISNKLNKLEVEDAVYIAAQKYIPNINLNIDFNIVGNSKNNPELLDVVMIAARTDLITHKVELLSSCGLNVVNIEPKSHAVMRALGHYFIEAEPIALIDVNSSSTRIYIIQQNELLFENEEILNIAIHSPAAIEELLCDWIQRMCVLFYVKYGKNTITQFLLSGEFQFNSAHTDSMRRRLKTAVSIFDPLPYASHYIDHRQALVTACGLAMHEMHF